MSVARIITIVEWNGNGRKYLLANRYFPSVLLAFMSLFNMADQSNMAGCRCEADSHEFDLVPDDIGTAARKTRCGGD